MILKHISRLWESEDVRNKVLVTIGLVLVYKLMSLVPVPGVQIDALQNLKSFLQASQGLAFFSSMLGG